ncbi:hypothetical protein [Pseudomonas syringae]|uniref:hypothetical protein n=1 Tax=Pseudomonas syringae TaxID=317 RepID=UPI0010104141|nr:hypothetical protein [Pseudomonas syringae]
MSENNSNDDPPKKNILVDLGIPMRPDSDLSKNFHIGAESNGSNSGWNIGVVGSGNGGSRRARAR